MGEINVVVPCLILQSFCFSVEDDAEELHYVQVYADETVSIPEDLAKVMQDDRYLQIKVVG